VRLSDEAYEIVTDIAEEEGGTLPKQIDYLAKRLAEDRKKTYEEACSQADVGETIWARYHSLLLRYIWENRK
jgi:hypothetical protein